MGVTVDRDLFTSTGRKPQFSFGGKIKACNIEYWNLKIGHVSKEEESTSALVGIKYIDNVRTPLAIRLPQIDSKSTPRHLEQSRMILKLRVPNFIEKHLIMDFLTADGAKLWADITELRRSFGYGDIPVYMVDDNEEHL